MAGPSSPGVTAWASLLRTHAAVLPKLGAALAGVGMPLSWYDVLLEVNAAPGREIRMTDLGHKVVLSRERVSRVVGELQAAGLLERRKDKDDGRSVLATMTAEGRRRLTAAAPVYLAAIERHFGGHLTTAELTQLSTSLGKVLDVEEGPR